MQLVGEAMNVSSGSNNWHAMIVVDLFMSGLRYKVIGPCNNEINQRLRVNFRLDDQIGTEISKEVRVINNQNEFYGCEFLTY